MTVGFIIRKKKTIPLRRKRNKLFSFFQKSILTKCFFRAKISKQFSRNCSENADVAELADALASGSVTSVKLPDLRMAPLSDHRAE